MAQGFLSHGIYVVDQQIVHRVEIEWIQYQFVIRNIQVVAFVED